MVGLGIQNSGSEGIRMRSPNTCVCVKYELETRHGLRKDGPQGQTPGWKDLGIPGRRVMGVQTFLLSERNRNLDFSVLNEEAVVGPGSLVLNLEGTRRSGFWDPQKVGGATLSQSGFFSTSHSLELQFPCGGRAEWSYVISCSAALSARAQRTVGPCSGLPQARPLHLSPPCCPRATEATRGLRLPASVARSHACVPH